jgi:lycopene cyclase domain-containing protein
MSLYLIIELCSLAIPLIFSFEKKVAFYKYWKFLIPSILITAIFFIAFDIFFTKIGIWGFNAAYVSSLFIAGLPIEELIFFLVIPYVSIFIHYVFINYFPAVYLTRKITLIITWTLITGLSAIIILFHDRTYTLFYAAIMAILLLVSLFIKGQILNRFYITFLIILVPFFLVNGILTGSFIPEEVIWYNESEIAGFRITTIPFEDILYGFSLILINLLLMSTIQKYYKKKHSS